jgi:hypothetical protein
MNCRLAIALLIVATAAASPAQAAGYRNTSAGGACHPANGAATKFTRANNYITNNNATAQFVVCNFQMDDAANPPDVYIYLALYIQSASAGTTVTCVAQTGNYDDLGNHVRSSASRTYTFASDGGASSLGWEPGTLVRLSSFDVLTLNCKMDPGTRLGTIVRTEF